MRLLRTSASLSALICISLLAACGGGGGSSGGGTPPVNNPPPPPTSSSPSPSPTPTPTQAPSTPPPVTTSSSIIIAGDAVVNGNDTWQTNGVTTSDVHDGDTATGASSSNSFGTIDNLGCSINTEPAVSPVTYHVHAFVGILVNGHEMAVPDAIGMKNPDNNEPILGFSCAYNLHTHGASGIIHVEDPTISGNWNTKPAVSAPTKYNLQALLDIWGQSVTGLAGGTGSPAVYVSTEITKNPSTGSHQGEDVAGGFAPYTGSLSSLLLSHHTAIWLVYGTPPAAGLPQVDFAIEN